MSKEFSIFMFIVMNIILAALIDLKYENNRLDAILKKYSDIEYRSAYVSGCIYGGGSFETCTNAYYSAFLPRVKE